ncbi:MAG: copper chaperone PCu(A)C [Neisseria sp.]|nr:copper chaperone PCu(A)C [Neisseria sp.]
MKKICFGIVAALLAQAALASGIRAENAWARETVDGMSMGGVFMGLANHSQKDDVLIGASSPVAEKVEIHEHIHENGMMKMREKAGGLALPKGKTLELKPGGYHVMLMGLKHTLKADKTFPLTLQFKHGGKQRVEVRVQPNAGGVHHHHRNHDHNHHAHEHHRH